MLDVKIRPHAHDQLEIMVGRRRVGYVVAKPGAPINFLKKAQSGIELTDDQKVFVAEQVREQLDVHMKSLEEVAGKLRSLISGGGTDVE